MDEYVLGIWYADGEPGWVTLWRYREFEAAELHAIAYSRLPGIISVAVTGGGVTRVWKGGKLVRVQ